MDRRAEITQLLHRSRDDPSAREAVYQLVYDDLRGLAGHRIAASRPGETLSVTSLVNEAYLKLTERTGKQWSDRNHFLRVAATAMRQITIDHVRAKLTDKRGAGKAALPLNDLDIAIAEKSEMVLAMEDGLQQLAVGEPRWVQIVECRFFAGLTVAETASALGTSESTIERDWVKARRWLRDYLTS